MKKNITVPPRTLVVVEMQTVIPGLEGVGYYDFMPTERYVNQEINLGNDTCCLTTPPLLENSRCYK